MKPALVTGATGFLGWHIAKKLLGQDRPVRVLVRDPSRLSELEGAEAYTGDLRDPDSLRAAVDGCALVYHVAADYRLWARNSRDLFESNVDGTRNMLTAARTAGVERFVYTSTVGCIGIPPGGIGDEDAPVGVNDMTGAYKESKFLAERVAMEYAETGFPVVIVNPTAPVGDHDVKPTPTGRIVLDYLNKGMPAYLDTGLNLVDVRDTAEGHLLACERGEPGERYILGSENLTLKEIFKKLESITGISAPSWRIPYHVAYAAGLASTAWANVTGIPPRAPLDGVKMARKKMFVSHDKAARDLGYQPAPAHQALERAVEWFHHNGYCSTKSSARGTVHA